MDPCNSTTRRWLISLIALFGLITILLKLMSLSAVTDMNWVQSLGRPSLERASSDSVTFTNWQTASQSDPDLVSHIKNEWIHSPSTEPLNLTKPNRTDYSQDGQSVLLDKLLKKKRYGFYVECGAYDGEYYSNTLYFEKYRGWNGLVIEADPTIFDKLRKKHRHAYSLSACLSPTKQASKLNYTVLKKAAYFGGLQKQLKPIMPKVRKKDEVRVLQLQCFPLYSILLALGNPHVDFFSLDIEGAEIAILKTIPFNEVNIDRILIEVNAQKKKIREIEKLLKPFGYRNLHIHSSLDMIMSKI